MRPSEIANRAINFLNDKITDKVFLLIQNNDELMYEYLKSVEDIGLDKTNQVIGKTVKSRYNLENEDREYNPKSTLIQSHTKF